MSHVGRKVKIEVEIDADLLARAAKARTDLSDAAENGIRRVVGGDPADLEERKRIWKEENAEAIESNNRYVEKHGLPLAGYRRYPWPDSTST